MIDTPIRAALLVDYENLISTLKHQSQTGNGDFGTAASLIDFEALVGYIRKNYGSLTKEDFIVAANFTHYNPQLGGLNRLATLIELDSFEAREFRSKNQNSAGKRYVVENYADMALAFEAGRHAALHPADIYIFITGDKAFSAVASLIYQKYQREVRFIFPNPDSAGIILKERYIWQSFSETQAISHPPAPDKNDLTSEEIPVKIQSDPADQIRELIAALRKEFSTAVPTNIVRAALGPSNAQRLLDRSRTEEKIDLWQSDAGIECISLIEERLYGKIIRMETRPTIAAAANILLAAAQTAQSFPKPASRADWRKAIKQNTGISSSESKKWLEILFQSGILRNQQIGVPLINQTTIICFLHLSEGSPD